MLISFALDHDVARCKLHYIDCSFGGIEVEVRVEDIVDSVEVDDVDIEEVKDFRSNWKEAMVAPDDGGDVKVEEVEDSHEVGHLYASQVHLVNIADAEKNDGTVALLLHS